MPLCHARLAWSWGVESLTIPRDAHGPLGSSNVLFLASFPPEFNMPVPADLHSGVSRYPIQLEGAPGAAADPPTEEYPEPVPGVMLARRQRVQGSAGFFWYVGRVAVAALQLAIVTGMLAAAKGHLRLIVMAKMPLF